MSTESSPTPPAPGSDTQTDGASADGAQANRIVVGVDGSATSKLALRWAAYLAGTTGAALEAVIAWEPISSYSWASAGWSAFPDDWNPAADAEKVLETTLAEVFADDRPAELSMTVTEGNSANVLLEASQDARMLIVGSRGHGGFAGLLLGSVSSACAEHANCPVLVIHGNNPPPAA